jgi:hypothetical protein
MNLQLIFRTAIVIDLVFAFAFVFVDIYLIDTLPQLLQDYLLWEQNQKITSIDLSIMGTVLLLAIVHIVASISLILLQPWAKKPYIFTGGFLLLAIPFYGPTVEHAFTSTIGGISSTLFGVILTMLLLCNVLPSKEMAKK